MTSRNQPPANPERFNDACGVIGLVTALEFKSVCFYGFVVLLCAVCVPRARDLGLPALCGLFPPLMVLADSAFGLYVGAGWAAAFTAGILFIPLPFFLLFAATMIVFACVAPANSLRRDNIPTLRMLLFGLGAALIVAAVLSIAQIWALAVARVYPPWLMVALLVVLTTLSWRGRGVASNAEVTPTNQKAGSTRG